MTLRNCSILFDNRPDKVFYCGETVTGTVNLTLEKNKKCQGECIYSSYVIVI